LGIWERDSVQEKWRLKRLDSNLAIPPLPYDPALIKGVSPWVLMFPAAFSTSLAVLSSLCAAAQTMDRGVVVALAAVAQPEARLAPEVPGPK
jgi:hypothetical protein